jgi:tRNA(Met) C34 N-acetyltransferase TmcA
VFERLRKGGLFIMIDEWPPLLTRRSSTSPRLDPEIEAQFEGTFRPVHTKSDLRDKVMANVPEARFVAEFRIKIDEYHSMTVFVYMKDPLKSRSRKKPWPSTRKEARSQDTCLEQCTRARQAAFERLLAKFRAVDDIFVREYLAINGERELWEIVKPFSTQGQAVFNDPTVVEIPQGSKYDVIVLPSLHNIREDTRPKLIADAIEALNQGGILLFTGEWPAPKRSRHPLDKRAMRNGLVEPHLKDLIFEAALREPISAGYASALYLWAYRKR